MYVFICLKWGSLNFDQALTCMYIIIKWFYQKNVCHCCLIKVTVSSKMFGSVYCKKNYLYNMNNYKLCFLLYIATLSLPGTM